MSVIAISCVVCIKDSSTTDQRPHLSMAFNQAPSRHLHCHRVGSELAHLALLEVNQSDIAQKLTTVHVLVSMVEIPSNHQDVAEIS